MTARNITQMEIPALSQPLNFTDGHAHRSWTAGELQIVRDVGRRIEHLSREDLPRLEEEYLDAIFSIGRKTRVTHSWICNSASQAVEILANVLRLQDRINVCLVEPCFDNLADIFKRHGLKLFPVSDVMYQQDWIPSEFPTPLGACCLVSPNNPTGAVLSRQNVRDLITTCEKVNSILIVDSAFRAFDGNDDVDLYEELRSASCPWAIIEDTGKTWPTLELKASVLSVSDSLSQITYDIYTDMLLHSSPVTLAWLTEMLRYSVRDNMESIRSIVKGNRLELAQALGGKFEIESAPFMSVAWVRTSPYTGDSFARALAREGIYALPGRRFYWTGQGDVPYVRFALNRDPDKYRAASARIIRTLHFLASTRWPATEEPVT